MARGRKSMPLEVGQPEWSASTAVNRVRDLLQRGRGLERRGAPKGDRQAWEVAVDSTMASAFGRNSDEHLSVESAIQGATVMMAGDWETPDDYPARLGKQLSVIEEYV